MKINFDSIEIEGIDYDDYPDFWDAFVCYAEYENGKELSGTDYDLLNYDGQLIQELVWKHIF